MIRFSPTFFILILASTLSAQESNSRVGINTLFELRADSIEQRITVNKWGTDTSYYLNFQVKNISIDTLTYKTNTCFYYNHSVLTVDDLEFDLNPNGGCLYNSYNIYQLAPGESFSESQWITAYDYKLNKLKIAEWNSILSVPLIKDDSKTYRVDGREFVENEQYLIYKGKIRVIRTMIDNRKRKKKKKST